MNGHINEKRLLSVMTGRWVYGCLLFLCLNFSIDSPKNILGSSLLVKRCLNCADFGGNI